MKCAMKYPELHYESSGERYENQNECGRARYENQNESGRGRYENQNEILRAA